MAHTKAGGSVKNVHDSPGRRLGVKLFGDELVAPGQLIVRQRGTRMEVGPGAAIGRDHTIYATISGQVKFITKQITKFTGQKVRRTIVGVHPVKASK
jgi:large subunit ribosomal protein L27